MRRKLIKWIAVISLWAGLYQPVAEGIHHSFHGATKYSYPQTGKVISMDGLACPVCKGLIQQHSFVPVSFSSRVELESPFKIKYFTSSDTEYNRLIYADRLRGPPNHK